MATNRDKITNEKLARMIIKGVIEPCNYCILKGGCYSITGDSKNFCIQNIENWLSQEAEEDNTIPPTRKELEEKDTKTADEMFEELNYSKEDTNNEWIRYCKLSEDCDYDYDSITINKKTYLYYKESVKEKFDKRRACGITEAEEKAIHKKISELKEGLENGK